MSRTLKSFASVRLLSVLTAAALCLVPALTARGASYVYGSQQRTVNAGVLINGTASMPVNQPSGALAAPYAPDPSPYVFYLFNLRADVKPFGWNVVNPQAPSVVSVSTTQRWVKDWTVTPHTSYYAVGQAVHPNMAAYWEVPLSDTSAEQLAQYDVLYLPLGGVDASGSPLALSPSDNEKLRRFVDGGGQLWVEADPHTRPVFTLTAPTFTFPVSSTGFFSVSITQHAPAGPALPASGVALLRQPILTQPFLMSFDDLFGMGLTPGYTVTDTASLFGNALLAGSSPSVDVSQYGAGQIIASALDVGGAINDFAGDAANAGNVFQFNAGPFCGSPGDTPADLTANGFVNPAAAPTADLRFLSNLISLAGTHPNENKTGRQNASNNDPASFAPAWAYPVTPPTTGAPDPPPGAAVWGNFIYVTTYGTGPGGSTGTIHAFDAYPAEFLTAIGLADDGLPDFGASPPTAYDEIWHQDVGPNASAPTVATYGSKTYVFVERADGSVLQFDTVQGTAGTPLTPPPAIPAATPYPNAGVANAPAPVVYEGRVYAGQPNGDLFVYDIAGAAGYRVPLVLAPTQAEAVCGSPSVGVLADGNLTNDIVAIVPTTQNVYTVFLGAHADLLKEENGGYDVNRSRLRLYTLKLQSGLAYIYTSTSSVASANTSGTTPDFSPPPTLKGALYADYLALLEPATAPISSFANGQTLDLNSVSDFSYGAVTNGILPSTAVVSAPATDRNGDLYYTVNAGGNSYLFGVHQDPQFQNVKVKFRFRLPKAGEAITDGDGVSYAGLEGAQFVGAPVIDGQGFVYAAAQNGANAAILCFSTTQPIYADVSGGFDPSTATFTQADEFNATQPNQLRPGPVDGTLKYGQFSASGDRVTFFNFGIGTGQIRQIAGNLTEPQPVQATPSPDPNLTQQNLNSVTLPLHTNLQWFGTFALASALAPKVSGVTKVGSSLYLTDGLSLYQFPANPTLTGKVATLTPTPVSLGLAVPTAPLASVAPATPSAGTGVLVVNSLLGVAASTQQLTLVTDNNRVVEVDSTGKAVWGVDATSRPSQTGTTYMDFSHPTSLSQINPNDYLVADTGNNRCVRFDRAGDIIWELTHFTDSTGILGPGQPLSLNAPTSVQINRYRDRVTGISTIHYLIADSGNSRVLEVTDTLDPTGKVTSSHDLTWASHTLDKFGRHYRYASATYFNVISGVPTSIVAAVTNTRLAPMGAPNTGNTANALGSASGDAQGGSLIGFSYAIGQTPFASVPPETVTGIYTSFQVQGGATYQVRNPRYLTVYTPPTPPATGPSFSVLYADDNGAFDLTPTATGFVAASNNLHFLAGVPSDPVNTSYHSMNVPAIGVTFAATTPSTGPRNSVPFVPSCVQRLNSNAANPEYLITQTYSQPELGNDGSRIGGEVFEVDGNTAVGGFNGATLSRPGLTGPLAQPTSAIRPQQ